MIKPKNFKLKKKIRYIFFIRLLYYLKINNMNSSEKYNIEINNKVFYQMNFIYNAVVNGWTVTKINENKYEFTNRDKDIKKQFNLENFTDDFVKKNMMIDNIVEY